MMALAFYLRSTVQTTLQRTGDQTDHRGAESEVRVWVCWGGWSIEAGYQRRLACAEKEVQKAT